MNRPVLTTAVGLFAVCTACSAPMEPSTRGTGAEGGGGSGGTTQAPGGGASAAGAAAGGAGTAGVPSGGSAGSAGSGGASGGGSGGGGSGLESREAMLYRLSCLSCHGQLGAGITTPMNLGPEIQHPIRDYTRWVVRNGLPSVGYMEPMEPWYPVDQPDKEMELILSDADMELIFDFLDKPPKPTTGQGLYNDYCANCHGADGLGGVTTRPVVSAEAIGQFAAVVRSGTHLGMQGSRTEYMPAFDQTILTDAEVQLMLDYVSNVLAP